MVCTQNFVICALLPWPCRYDPVSRSWQTFWSWTMILWSIQIQHGRKELWPGTRILALCALLPWPLRCEIVDKKWSCKEVRSYAPTRCEQIGLPVCHSKLSYLVHYAYLMVLVLVENFGLWPLVSWQFTYNRVSIK